MKKVAKIFFICLLIFSAARPCCAASSAPSIGTIDSFLSNNTASTVAFVDSAARKAALDSAVAARIAAASRYTTSAKDRAALTAQEKPVLKRSALPAPPPQVNIPLVSGDKAMGLSELSTILRGLCFSSEPAAYICGLFLELSITASIHDFDLPGRNVVACIEGSTEEYIVVAAHYDVVKEGYPGANSNASGVVTLLEIARRLQSVSRIRPLRKGVIFVALDGHFREYAGAKALLKELGSRRVAQFISLDIMGNAADPVDKRRPLYLMALGAEPYRSALKSCAKLGRLETYTEYYRSDSFTRWFYRKTGDQTVFLQAGVPCIVFTSGITVDTNKPTDTPDKVNLNALHDRSLAISRFLLSLLR